MLESLHAQIVEQNTTQLWWPRGYCAVHELQCYRFLSGWGPLLHGIPHLSLSLSSHFL